MATRDVFNRKRQRKGRTCGIGFVTKEPQSLRERVTQRRVLEVVLPAGRLTAQQLKVLYDAQQAALREGVEVIYYQAR